MREQVGQRAMASTRRILDLLAVQPTIVSGTAALPRPLAGAVRFDDVHFSYATGTEVLDGLDLDIRPGETHAVVGPTGAGKSTVVKLLLRLYEPTAGTVSLDDVDVRDLRLDELRGASAARSCPGQRQRLSIARAIVRDPAILVLDEATSAVENETEAAIQRSLETVSRDRTTLVIAHRLGTVRHTERIHVLENGRVGEAGTHDELIAAGGLYAALWRVQTGEATTRIG